MTRYYSKNKQTTNVKKALETEQYRSPEIQKIQNRDESHTGRDWSLSELTKVGVQRNIGLGIGWGHFLNN